MVVVMAVLLVIVGVVLDAGVVAVETRMVCSNIVNNNLSSSTHRERKLLVTIVNAIAAWSKSQQQGPHFSEKYHVIHR